jgi:adenine specific DNA methylase Mod
MWSELNSVLEDWNKESFNQDHRVSSDNKSQWS